MSAAIAVPVAVQGAAPVPNCHIVGYIEAVTTTHLHGWAWAPQAPGETVSLELRLDDLIVASGLADQPRDDLARNGIGDGRHAFSFAVPSELAARAEELRVHARLGDGPFVLLGTPPPPENIAERLERLQQMVGAIGNSQRVIHRSLQQLLIRAEEAKVTDGATSPSRRLAEQIESIEAFLMRIDKRTNAIAPDPTERSLKHPREHAAVVAGSLVLLAAALAVSAWMMLANLHA